MGHRYRSREFECLLDEFVNLGGPWTNRDSSEKRFRLDDDGSKGDDVVMNNGYEKKDDGWMQRSIEL